MGYRREAMVATPGDFSVRGGIVDIYPLDQEHPIRLDFFDDELDSLRYFDAETQRSLEMVENLILLPATDIPFEYEVVFEAKTKIKKAYEKDIKSSESDERTQLLTNQMNHLLNQLEEGEIPPKISYWLELFYKDKTTILDYVSKKRIFISR